MVGQDCQIILAGKNTTLVTHVEAILSAAVRVSARAHDELGHSINQSFLPAFQQSDFGAIGESRPRFIRRNSLRIQASPFFRMVLGENSTIQVEAGTVNALMHMHTAPIESNHSVRKRFRVVPHVGVFSSARKSRIPEKTLSLLVIASSKCQSDQR